ncbi:flavin-containing monooxygenase [Ruegeria marina]|uniref:Cyclohexanone monooxygenase n=1 Tax=Ruegeria marina TaxID=639004 RepID=A0A1G6VI83_9RHOB|nr:NAD(P)/FAD-dependent oxidoreductase [Ruegeria marina]SDD53211.1 cyclohexanone monooxygenase [Ruegeria marina]
MAHTETLIVGAGLAGLRALYALREQGISAVVLEASDEIGGVWNHNRYPGARCDVESFDYSYSFSKELEQEWRWSERYPTQPEILRYINHVADRFDLRRDIVLNARVEEAVYDEDQAVWEVTTSEGCRWTANTLMLCLGQLSAPKIPSYPGQEDFGGEVIVSAMWPRRQVDFTGKRVGIIGTGSSGMQMTPVIAETAAHLTVFQRTANYSLPAANAPLTDEEDARVKANYDARREQIRNSPTGLGFQPGKVKTLDVSTEEREAALEKSYHRLGFGFALTFPDILLDAKANAVASDFLKRKMGERVADPELRKKLVPNDHGFGTRRPSVDGGYFEAFARDNVELADIREHPIVEFTPNGIRTDEKLHELDIVIFATGFDALTGALLRPRIVGRSGQTLAEKWADGPLTQLGLATAGFPNMVIVAGPGSPSVLSNVIVSIEEHADWFARMLAAFKAQGIAEFEATKAAERAWTDYVQQRARETLYGTANSFYNGGEVKGKPRVFMPFSGGVRNYRQHLQKCADENYSGFEKRKTPAAQKSTEVHRHA